MRLTLERDNGEKTSVVIEGEPAPGDRLEMMRGICVLLDSWATEMDKDRPSQDD